MSMSKKNSELLSRTEWGKEFLHAIGRLDTDKRLERGRKYAKAGNVEDITITGNNVKSKVRGTSLYKVTVTFQKWKEEDVKKVCEIIENNPLYLADILNSVLPGGLLGELEKNKVSLFPTSWREIQRKCSCPDVGDPCKHMAAVYFLLASEIDKNPFTLFNLKGMDLMKIFHVSKEDTKVPFPITLEYDNEKKKEEVVTNSSEIQEQSQEIPKFEFVPFPENIPAFILSCLQDNPPFSQLNYKDVMSEFYIAALKRAPSYFVIEKLQEDDNSKIERIISHSNILFVVENLAAKPKIILKNDVFVDFDEKSIFDQVTRKSPTELELDAFYFFNLILHSCASQFGTDSYQFFFYLGRVLFQIVKTGLYIPSVLPLNSNNDEVKITFKALDTIEQVQKQFTLLQNICPADVISYDSKTLSPFSTVRIILALMLTDLFQNKMKFMHKKLHANPPKESRAIFFGETFIPASIGEKHTPLSISKFFGVFNLIHYGFQITVQVLKQNEQDEDSLFHIRLLVSSDLHKSLPLKEFIKEQPNLKHSVYKLLSSLSPYLPQVSELTKSNSVEIDQKTFETFIFETLAVFTMLGVQVLLPKGLSKVLFPKVVLSVKNKSDLGEPGSHQTFLKLNEMLEYDWMIALGDQLISVSEFELLVKKGKQLVTFQENYVALKPSDVKSLQDKLAKPPPTLNSFELLQNCLSPENVFLSNGLKKFLEGCLRQKQFEISKNLHATLRNYQAQGVNWMISNLLNGFGVILADDMGLGKTIQAIAALLFLKEQRFLEKKSSLIIAPASLLANWQKELVRFSPSLSIEIYHGSNRSLLLPDEEAEEGPPRKRQKKSEVSQVDVIITTYQTIRSDILKLSKMKLGCLIIDEAQSIKNHTTKVSECVKSLKAAYKIALSGTPVENRLSELWSIFDFALPKYLGTIKTFSTRFGKEIEVNRNESVVTLLKDITSPFMLRRLKTNKDIIKDLPEKIIDNKFTTLSPTQAALYEGVVRDVTAKLESDDLKGRGQLILNLISSLKQICNHPALYDKKLEIDIETSGKAKMLMTILETIIEAKEKVLIFTQYTSMAEILIQLIRKNLFIDPAYLCGSMPINKRESEIERFQKDKSCQVFVLSLKAGGVGLNLTQANHVIHYDLWWNPAVENQATDRAFRIGQEKNVVVYRFITESTFEEKIDQMIQSKKDLSEMSVSVGENWLCDLSDDQLVDLFSLSKE